MVVGAWVRPLDSVVSLVVVRDRKGAKSAVSISDEPLSAPAPAPAPLKVPVLSRDDCRLTGPAELAAEIDPRAREDSLLNECSVSDVRPSLSGCHLAYFLFASRPDTVARLRCFVKVRWRSSVEVCREDSPLVGCCEGSVLSTRKMPLELSMDADQTVSIEYQLALRLNRSMEKGHEL